MLEQNTHSEAGRELSCYAAQLVPCCLFTRHMEVSAPVTYSEVGIHDTRYFTLRED